MNTYQLRIIKGHSFYDHLAPIIDESEKFSSLAAARKEIRAGVLRQGSCAWMSSRVRVDIIRSDGKRFENEECSAGKGIKRPE